jgi:nitrogen fixation/metabolism regulation signal transduction histidine kinase
VSLRSGTSATLTGLLSLILLYVVLITLVLVFAGQVLGDLSFTRTTTGVAVIVVAVVFPLVLLGLTIVNLVRLMRQRAVGRPGARFKSRLIVFFVVIVILASVPQAILSVNFIRAATRSWFSADTGDALRGAQEITLSFYGEAQEELERFVESRFLAGVLDGLESQPSRVWERVRAINPGIDAMQVWNPLFTETYFAGPEELRITASQASASREGQVVRGSTAEVSYLRVRTTFTVPGAGPADGVSGFAVPGGAAYTVVFSSRLPERFDAIAGQLSDSLEFFVQLERFQTGFITAIAVFYAFFAVPLFLLSVLVSFFLSEEVIRPIVSLEEATRKIAEGDFSIRILSRRGDELSLLVDSFNRMVTELERTRTKIIQTEKIAAWQEIAQRLAHEIKNPLTPIRLAAERSLRKYETGSPDFDSVFRSSVNSIVNEVENLNSLLTEFREFSRLPPPDIRRVPLLPLVQDVASTYAQHSRYIMTTDGIPEGFTLDADPVQLKQVLANLFKNAMEAMPDGGEITVAADLVKKGESAYGRIQIEDNGPGIQSEYQNSIFNPYVTTKRHGTGLGLAIVERIVFDHHGHIWFETQSGVGTTFYVDLPVVDPPPPRQS